jgi:hypothetical protein
MSVDSVFRKDTRAIYKQNLGFIKKETGIANSDVNGLVIRVLNALRKEDPQVHENYAHKAIAFWATPHSYQGLKINLESDLKNYIGGWAKDRRNSCSSDFDSWVKALDDIAQNIVHQTKYYNHIFIQRL